MPKQEETSKRGRGRPKKRVGELKAFQVRIPKALHKDLKLLSVERDESMNDLIERAIEQLMRRYRR